VGVVIEDDGLTEEEFRHEMLSRNEELNALSKQADELMGKINEELKGVLG
jgi:type I restriction enzyme M protein